MAIFRKLSFTPSPRTSLNVAIPRGSLVGPAIDISEDDKTFKLTAELPGLDAKAIEIALSGDILVIKGQKQLDEENTIANWHFTERSYGPFHRAFELPASVARDNITAEFSKGVLTVRLPKETGDIQGDEPVFTLPTGPGSEDVGRAEIGDIHGDEPPF